MVAITHPENLDIPTSINGFASIIRRYKDGDGKSMFATIDKSRDSLAKWLPWLSHHQTEADSEAYARRMQAQWVARKDFVFSLWHRETNEYIGAVGLHQIDWEVPKMVMGYFICPPYEGKGYGTQAAAAVLEFAFDHLGAERISATCDVENERSWRLMERIGMKREGTIIKHMRDHHGSLRDTYFYGFVKA